MEWEEFCGKVLKLILPIAKFIDFMYDSKKISYIINKEKFVYTRKDYEKFISEVDNYKFSPYSVYDGKYYEVSLNYLDDYTKKFFMYGMAEKLIDASFKDNEKSITYSFKECSDVLVWYMIKYLTNDIDITYRLDAIRSKYRLEILNDKSIFNIVKLTVRIPLSLVVSSENVIPKEKLQCFSSSFLFNFSYNFDMVIKPIVEYDDLFSIRIVNRKKRINKIDDIEVPYYMYKQELIDQYHMALSSGDPFVKFIGFYHIMEHFYEDVYNDDMVKNVQNIIRDPGFSSKRKKDILKLVDAIKKKVKQNREEFIGSEVEALELTLRKYVDISKLVNDLVEFDPTIIDYYKLNEVSFCSGDIVDLNDIDIEKIYKRLASRIYKTRNALVHNKSNENRLSDRGIYKPFTDNKKLCKEIPLVRFIAEAIIIGSASNL